MMKLRFRFAWLKPGKPLHSAFKQEAALHLTDEYIKRISKFVPCEVKGLTLASGVEAGGKVWVCDRGPGAKVASSEEVAKELRRALESGGRTLDIVIGGPDGYTAAELAALKPDFRWSFGSLTLPHELAAVVASEQVYRAFSILKGLPYHSGH